jgi:hypothetical protein
MIIRPRESIEYIYDEATDLYRRVGAIRVVVHASDATTRLISEALGDSCLRARTATELAAAATRPNTIAFVEVGMLCHASADIARTTPIVGVIDDAHETLPSIVRAFEVFPWLSHFTTTSAFTRPGAQADISRLVANLTVQGEHDLVSAAGYARVARLATASRRDVRCERMSQFFVDRGVSGRTIARLQDICEELVTNALYDAPFEGGYFSQPVPRTEDVDLPRELACEVSYGFDDGMAYVRVRDPFGALTRARVVAVWSRCKRIGGVSLDESRGGAGLGLWRVLLAASTVSIRVHPGELTEITVGIATKDKRDGNRLRAIELSFRPGGVAPASMADEYDLMDESFTLVRVA